MKEKEKKIPSIHVQSYPVFLKGDREWADIHEICGCTTFLVERLYQILSK